MSPPLEDPSVTVVVRRRTKPGCEADFEVAMREFIVFALSSPGNRGIHVLRSDQANPREYTVVDRFADSDSRRAFTTSECYKEWMVRLRALTEEDPHIEEMGGLSGWFTLPGEPAHKPPPKPKMALVTFMGVYPLTSLLPPFFGKLLPAWPHLLRNVLVTGLVVALLTWVVMPNLTKLLKRWLFKA
ncbi:antibiotic biosynthesis monooxygenase [Luteolibacter flavescens]|uniref:Antibiotic biosynthesis monooxygenase n=1 Tax=Luteolibacter flavescens TaxID=1859460 RepID=A0ABT3FUT0_9BACT|nr:antibiotic biosynthesis monooxygenase [Luteolibacter flavescens]MCW1887337.1 antibiotic biosynthesis monooxygenase [Luteolibacter flavescens]